MKDFDQLVQDALKPFKIDGNQRGDETLPNSRKNAIFEDFTINGQFDELLHHEWHFATPKTSRPVQTSITKTVKTTFPRLNIAELDLVFYLSSQVDKLKKSLVAGQGVERNLLAYSKLIAVLDHVFENNIEPYSYYLPRDSSAEATGNRFLYSEHFLFEHLQALLHMVANYTEHETHRRPRSESYALAIAALQEMYDLCERALQESPSTKIQYLPPPTSINNKTATTKTNTFNQEKKERYVETEVFIRVFLGGLSGIRARIHLCEAKRYECLLLQSPDQIQLMTEIERHYRASHQETPATGSKLWHYTRFMTHYWLCRRHFTLANIAVVDFLDPLIEENETLEQLELARETLARLLYVLGEVKHMDVTGQTTLTLLDAILLKEYHTLVNDASQLTKTIDTQIYDKRRMKETQNLSFELSRALEVPRSNLLKVTRQEAFKKYLVAHPQLENALATVRQIYEAHCKGEKIVRLNLKQHQAKEEEEAENALVEHLDNVARFAVLEERSEWLKWLRGQFSLTDSQFELSSDLYSLFGKELDEVERRKAMYEK